MPALFQTPGIQESFVDSQLRQQQKSAREESRAVVLRPNLFASHLGDVLCLSPLPRLLNLHRGLEVYVADGPIPRGVFKNNPYVVGMARRPRPVSISASPVGYGHALQRVLQSFELPLHPIPKPELYFSEQERAWARQLRSKWSTNRPVCLLSCGALTDADNLAKVNWTFVVQRLARRFTVVQAIGPKEIPIPGAIPCRRLSLRHYLCLFTAVDFFVGGTSGGTHIAAALDIPAIVVIWQALQDQLHFPILDFNIKSFFLYPQHWFIASEEISYTSLNQDLLDNIIVKAIEAGPLGRPTMIGSHTINPCGFVPKAPPRIEWTGDRRLVRVPTVYGERELDRLASPVKNCR
jgi:hypothetical protein